MPRKTNNSPPPEVMTWARATPVLILCVIFDALRFFFDMFWFFGPALAAVICTVQAGGSAVAGGICTIVAGTVGFFGAGAIETFGVVMAMAVGLIGWLTIFLIQLMNNAGIFKENFSMILRFAVGLLISEIPIINALPSLTIVNITMFNIQIKKGREAMKKWEEENAAVQQQKQNQQMEQLTQARTIQQQASNDALYNQAQAANDEKYNDGEVRKAV